MTFVHEGMHLTQVRIVGSTSNPGDGTCSIYIEAISSAIVEREAILVQMTSLCWIHEYLSGKGFFQNMSSVNDRKNLYKRWLKDSCKYLDSKSGAEQWLADAQANSNCSQAQKDQLAELAKQLALLGPGTIASVKASTNAWIESIK